MLVYVFGSGAAFFLGIACIFVALVILALSGGRRPRIVSTLLAAVGLIVIALSSVPLPCWLYAVSGAATIAWLVAERFDRPWLATRRNCLRGIVAVVWAACATVELPHHFVPTVGKIGRPTST